MAVRITASLFTAAVVLSVSGIAIAAGTDSAPAIDVTNASITVTNGHASCHVGTDSDAVELSVGGAVDEDCHGDEPGEIDLDATEWDASSGELDSLTGKTNSWVAQYVDSQVDGTTIGAQFNDKETDDRNDDPSLAVQTKVTGFKGGCNLNIENGGDFTWFTDDTRAGDATTNMSGELGWANKSAEGEMQEAAKATWTLVVEPEGTKMKGKVKANARAQTPWSTARTVKVETKDGDPDDAGSVQTNVPATIGVITFNHNKQNDDAVAIVSAVAAFQSDDGWMASSILKKEDVSEDVDWQTDSGQFTHTANGTFTDKPGEKRQAAFRTAYKITLEQAEGGVSASGKATAQTAWKFSITEKPSYVE